MVQRSFIIGGKESAWGEFPRHDGKGGADFVVEDFGGGGAGDLVAGGEFFEEERFADGGVAGEVGEVGGDELLEICGEGAVIRKAVAFDGDGGLGAAEMCDERGFLASGFDDGGHDRFGKEGEASQAGGESLVEFCFEGEAFLICGRKGIGHGGGKAAHHFEVEAEVAFVKAEAAVKGSVDFIPTQPWVGEVLRNGVEVVQTESTLADDGAMPGAGAIGFGAGEPFGNFAELRFGELAGGKCTFETAEGDGGAGNADEFGD